MFKQSLVLGTLLVLAMLIAVAFIPSASAVAPTPAGLDTSAIMSESRVLVSEAWDAF